MGTEGKKHLVYAILKYLDRQRASGQLSEDAAESLEVAAQCLGTVFEVNYEDKQNEVTYPLPGTLEEIFKHGLAHYQVEVQKDMCVTEVSPEIKKQAEENKAEGNEFMKQEKFQEALQCYTKAIELDSSNAVYYCNRAAAYSKLEDNHEALRDCERALHIDPNYSKAYGRKGLAHSALNDHQQALECYRKALELEPENPSYRQNLEIAEKKSLENPGATGAFPGGPGGMGGLNLGGLDFTSMLSNPALMNMATSMMMNPQLQNM